ncbi:hemocytin-like [Epargyreus clarus]|uniref:hemocytin-like n=1 Tax=Epargyreus clarus TaxID=520877 RepID=UPI003C30B3D0
MNLFTQSLICLLGLYVCSGQYNDNNLREPQLDVQAPAYVPSYAKDPRFSNPAYRGYTGTKTRYTGTKTGYGGTKTGYAGTKTGYAGTKTGYGGTKTGYGGTKNVYGEGKTWYSGSGSAPNYGDFHGNANGVFTPKCDIPCKNNGICVDTNTCRCPPSFEGKYCEFEKKPCLANPPVPMNSEMKCFADMCTIKCKEGHKFFDGSSAANIRCESGEWRPMRADLNTLSDCQPECAPPCANGGVCLAVNTCQCPEDFRGPQCQYSASACDIRKLAFNGGYSCSGDGEQFWCRLTCPQGASFSSPAAERYSCLYSTGVFEPQPVPHCVFDEVIVITPSNHPNPIYTIDNNKTAPPSESSSLGRPHNPHQVVVVQDLTPRGGSCLTWAGMHYKTFDGKIYSFESPCQHILLRDADEHKYTIAIRQSDCKSKDYCPSEITVYLEDKMYVLNIAEDGSVVFRSTKRMIPIPATLPGLRVAMPSDHVLVTLDALGVTLKWDTNVSVVTSEDGAVVFRSTKRMIPIPATLPGLRVAMPSDHVLVTLDALGVTLKWDTNVSVVTSEDGAVVFRSTKRMIPIPATLPGLRVAMPSDHVLVTLDALGVTLKWDTNNVVVIEGSVLLWNKTEGLCGTLDGNPENDMKIKDGSVAKTTSVMIASWQLNKIGDICDSSPTETSACASGEDMLRALQFCNKVFTKEKFRKCSTVMDVTQLLEACQWDYCACVTSLSPEECACSTVSVYAKECLRHGIEEMKSWRDADTCPMRCPDGKIYKSCGPDVQPSCAFRTAAPRDNASCVEGCFCPDGLFLENNRCVQRSECPCRARNKSFPPGAVIPKSCNTCTCQAGEWACTLAACGARCSAVGDPHYTSFDGLRYDFMGHCTYTLLSAPELTVDVENVACSGTISEAMNLTPYQGIGRPSCTKAVNLMYKNVNIHLKQGGFILVNGKEVSSLPVNIGDIRIRAVSSLFIIVQLPIKVDLWWDGNTRVYVDVPPSFQDKTKGLCGTFNQNQKDDFLTPEGDVEQSALAFANKWKTREFCSDVDTAEPEHPCQANMQNKESAEMYCSKLKSKLFESCHWEVDVQSAYEACVYDMCACAAEPARCLCPVLGDYAAQCALAGVFIDWRYHVKECELSCTGGQVYTVCADSCLRTCADVTLAAAGDCKPSCVEGCACPPGLVLDANNECVPVGLCPCYHKGMEFKPGYKEVRAGRREQEICTCVGAHWDCVPASPEDIKQYPPAEDLRSNCSAAHNMDFTTCQIAEPLTCKNMHLPPSETTEECRPGCQCKKGFVLDAAAGACVRPAACPCHHGGRSYPDGHAMQEECNTCECKSGNWTCTTQRCAGACGVWGDSHVSTFDGAEYDFEGVCNYLLAKGVVDGRDGFSVEIQNEPCGSTGATCSKSVTLRVGSGAEQEAVSLTKREPLPNVSKLKRIKLREAGAFVFLDVPTLGVSLEWDRGMRVYVRVDAIWQGRVKGLCGNYNSDLRDDFQSPGGGVTETSALIFVDSWKLTQNCPKPQDVTNHCKLRPERKEWSSHTCGALKRHPFSLCHSEVPPGAFVSRCERDACACDAGGDCACACTALAAYAHACAARGVTFKWRTQDMCPMQCDEECSNYSECMSPCPPETCDNTLDYKEIKVVCEKETCVEGCKPNKTCPEGTVYSNSSLTECVPRAKCKPPCMTLPDGREVLEGEVLEEDSCHTCRCSKKARVCTGQPCSTESTTPKVTLPPETTPYDQPMKCATGWTPWINRGPAETGPKGESIEKEPLPQPIELEIGSPMCKKDMMSKIECRTVEEHKPAKDTGLNVECSLEHGLVCEEKTACPDFEIRVYCNCTEEPFQCMDSNHPNYPHPTECDKFYECTPDLMNPDKPHTVLKTCPPGLMYNPKLMVCDWPAAVLPLRPECGTITTIPTTVEDKTETPAPTPGPCPPGRVPADCAYPCDQLCGHFKAALQEKGHCTNGQKCFGGCIEESVAKIKCEPGSMWRDEKTCVPIKDCTCEYLGALVKPGGTTTNGCEKCQCLDNEMHCDTTQCISYTIEDSSHLPMISTESHKTSPPINPTPVETTLASTISHTPETYPTTPAPTVTLPTTVPTTKTPPLQPNVTTPTLPTTIIMVTTVSPPPECKPDRYKNLLWERDEPLPKSAFTASSVDNPLFEPQFAILNGHTLDITAGSWNPSSEDLHPYIQVELPRPEPLYGVLLQGSPIFDEYVTSYDVMYGDDGNVFSHIEGPDGKPKVFRGPVDHENPMKQMFEPPIEAKFVRIRPLTWYDKPAVRFELIGCQEPETTSTEPPTVTTPEPPKCTDALGLGAELPLDSISTSTGEKARAFLKLDAPRGWRPLYSTPGEWIMFNFTSPRIITGVKTKGGVHGWVSAYSVLYSSDLAAFSPLLGSDGQRRLFPANFDKDTEVFNEFKPPIHAQYLKILPIKWEKNMEMRVEPVGCFEPYPPTLEPTTSTTAPPLTFTPTPAPACEPCPGVVPELALDCACEPGLYYDSENCVTREQCPCVVGITTYPVGATFRGVDCDECTCKMGGVPSCSPLQLCACAPDLVPKMSKEICECHCEPCANGTRICPTSKVCLPLEKWCDGLEDCPDDETACTTRPVVTETMVTTVAPTAAATKPTTAVTTPPTTVATTEAHLRPPLLRKRKKMRLPLSSPRSEMNIPNFIPKPCPKVECPPGYTVKLLTGAPPPSRYSAELPPPRPRRTYARYYKGTKTGYAKGGFSKGGYSKGGFSKGGLYGPQAPPQQNQAFSLEKPANSSAAGDKTACTQFRCIPRLPPPFRPGSTLPPLVCSAPACPPKYSLKLEKVTEGSCPQYSCVPPPERPVFCNVTGRTFNTFDGAEYKLDICFHMLARENRFNSWSVMVMKKCRPEGCRNELLIKQDDELILVKPTFMMNYDSFDYNVEQISKICSQKNTFDIGRLGNGLFIKSRKYNFAVFYTKDGDIKIGVSKSYMGQVDGLCGLFDGEWRNDRSTPSGAPARSLDEFGRSWLKPGVAPDACQPKVVKPDRQKEVWDLCDVITKEPLAQCASVLNLHKWRSICLEKICQCTDLVIDGKKMTDKECRCSLLEQMVAECLSGDKDVNIDSWRMQMDCPAECPAPLVHSDCYRKGCEPTCAVGGVAPACSAADGQCAPGCYCPEGKLRKGDTCVLPHDCRDCTCTGVGTPAKYVTFEGDNFPFLGNCTYLASRDRNETGHHKYEVYTTNGPCEENSATSCTKIVHLIHEKNVIAISKDTTTKKLVTTVNGSPVFKHPTKNEWATISLEKGQDVVVLLPDLYVELTVLQSNMEFTVRVPSSVYGNQTEGLCGVCDGFEEHLTTSNGTITDDFEVYGKSWQATPEVLQALEVPPQQQCGELPPPPPCEPPPPESNPCYNINNAEKFGICHALVDPDEFVSECEAEVCALGAGAACAALARYAAACRRHGVCVEWRGELCPYPCEAPLVYRPCVDCERSCDNNDELEEDPDKCEQLDVEGCFCPEGQVRVNNTCIEPNKCFPCDANKEHYAGDEWQEDACTKCTCSKVSGENAAHVACTSQRCAAPVCALGEDLVTREAPGACCPDYMCVPKPQDQKCEEPKKMECGFGQVLKQKTGENGCKEFVCECKPPSECEHIPSDSEVDVMEPGVVRSIDSSGCCPRAQLLCRPLTCPAPPSCPDFHKLETTNVTGKCCPEHKCELPKDKCVVQLEWEAAPQGGEKPRAKLQYVLKELDETWADGPCRSCRCAAGGGAAPGAACSVTECPALRDAAAVLEPRAVPFACCPVPVYVACKHQGNVYKIGENWTSTENVCESYVCSQRDDGKLEVLTTVQSCHTDCQAGWSYEPAAPESDKCCGKCVPVACVVDGQLKDIGSVWTSDDFCTNYTCINVNGTLQVKSSNETCPEVSEAMKKEFVLNEEKVPGKCCPKIKPVACRVDDKVYQVGEKWTSMEKVCESYECSQREDGKLEVLTTVKSCNTDCQAGWSYEPAAPESGKCCGKCVPVACVVDGQLKDIGSVWTSDDFCTNYTCINVNGTLQVKCSNETCPEVSEAMKKQFVLSEEKVPGKCCPKVEPVACRVGDKIYQEGQSWTTDDPCVNYTCTRDAAAQLSAAANTRTCERDCPRAYSYSAPPPGHCCGRCEQTACIVAGVLYEPGKEWKSEDNCTTYTCNNETNEMYVTSAEQQCPNLSECPLDDRVKEGCCEVCKQKPQSLSKCAPMPVPAQATVGAVRVQLAPHGLCLNRAPVRGLRECRGTCDTPTEYNRMTGALESPCSCCKAARYEALLVSLSCDDGSQRAHRVASAAACACHRCAEPPRPYYEPGKFGYSHNPYGYSHSPYNFDYTREADEYAIPDFASRFADTKT